MSLGNSANLENFQTNHFGFSATSLKNLGATEYTLATIVVDDSGSVYPHVRDIEKFLETIVEACRMSPRSDNLMIRVVKFNSATTEVHGFKLIPDITTYDNTLHGSGNTALYEATTNALSAMNTYGKTLLDQDYTVNGILFVVTDGMNNCRGTKQDVKREHDKAITGENLESLVSILIGVGSDADTMLKNELDSFATEVGMKFEWMGQLSAKKLAKFAEFVSRSISSQSQAAGSGKSQQIQSLTF